jgi:acetylglutamate kinase
MNSTSLPQSPLDQSPESKAAILIEALPYITRFRDKVVVVKYGGNVLAGADEASALKVFAEDIVLMRQVGMKPVVVHGGGPQIGELLARLNIQSEFRKGLRVTDEATLDVARMVLVGRVNRDIVSAINTHGALAVGVSGEDARLIEVQPLDPDLGFVGEITRINTSVLDRLLAEDLIPVIATIGCDAAGQAYNINANIEGLRRDVKDPQSLISTIGVAELDRMLADGSLEGGMIPKIESCIHAVKAGVTKAHILDGRSPHALLLEIFTNQGIGTEVTP